jgi:hypothetical protein
MLWHTENGHRTLFLLKRRHSDPAKNGSWMNPGGLVDPGEPDRKDPVAGPWRAAVREFGEEVGVPLWKFKAVPHLPKTPAPFYPPANGGKSLPPVYYFYMDTDTGLMPYAKPCGMKGYPTHHEAHGGGHFNCNDLLVAAAHCVRGTTKLPLRNVTGGEILSAVGKGLFPCETHAIYLHISPPAAHASVKSAIASQSQWGGLHMTVTGFALRSAVSDIQKLLPKLDVHGGSLRATVASAGARLNGWRPLAKNLTVRANHISVKSRALDNLSADCTAAGLARVTPPSTFHISIGNASGSDVVKALLDPKTTWTLCIAVRHKAPNAPAPAGIDAVLRLTDRFAL